jgi:S1-C subfamily serine protease
VKIRLDQVAILCLAVSCVLTMSSCSLSATSTTSEHADELADEASPAEQVLDAVYDSVVNIAVTATVGNQRGTGIGSGVVYTADGLILTNAHVVTLDGAVTGGQVIVVTFSSGQSVQASVVGVDNAADVAVIQATATGLHPVTFATPDDVKLGEWAIVIGSPLDFRNSVTLGIISGLDRTLDFGGGQPPLTGLIQIDAPISPGNSGGGCFDINGHFVGMPEVYLPPGSTGAENIGFAIPSNVVATVAKTITGR